MEITEEDLVDRLDDFKEHALGYVPYRYSPERERIQDAKTLEALALAIEAFLERTSPKDELSGEASDVPDPRNTPSARISVHRVYKQNLLPIVEEVRVFARNLTVVAEERAM